MQIENINKIIILLKIHKKYIIICEIIMVDEKEKMN
jgi:hypothetical protein